MVVGTLSSVDILNADPTAEQVVVKWVQSYPTEISTPPLRMSEIYHLRGLLRMIAEDIQNVCLGHLVVSHVIFLGFRFL